MQSSAPVVVPIGPGIGARIENVDLSGPLDDATFAFVEKAFTDHLVVVFPDQDLDPWVQLEFTERFGAVEPHPLSPRAGVDPEGRILILENKPGVPGARNDFWHSDISCMPAPPALSVLHALTVPSGKGDTLFCNMYEAYSRLPQELQTRLRGMTAVHSGEAIRQRNLASDSDARKDVVVPEPAVHPIVRKHPVSGRPALFTNRFFTIEIDGLSEQETDALLAQIEAVATTEDNIYRHRWTPGDVLMWDNRCTMHYADYDYSDQDARKLHRTTASGDRPIAA